MRTSGGLDPRSHSPAATCHTGDTPTQCHDPATSSTTANPLSPSKTCAIKARFTADPAPRPAWTPTCSLTPATAPAPMANSGTHSHSTPGPPSLASILTPPLRRAAVDPSTVRQVLLQLIKNPTNSETSSAHAQYGVNRHVGLLKLTGTAATQALASIASTRALCSSVRPRVPPHRVRERPHTSPQHEVYSATSCCPR